MDDLDEIARRSAQLQDRLVSAVTFSASAGAAALFVPVERSFMLLVAVGAVVWAVIEVTRLWVAAGDRVVALDRLVLAGSSDPRCQRRRSQLRSPRVHHRLARTLRQTCQQSHHSSAGIISLDAVSSKRAIRDAQLMIARCRAELRH